MKRIKYSDNIQMWSLGKQLESEGYVKKSDCYWYQDYQKHDDVVVLERI